MKFFYKQQLQTGQAVFLQLKLLVQVLYSIFNRLSLALDLTDEFIFQGLDLWINFHIGLYSVDIFSHLLENLEFTLLAKFYATQTLLKNEFFVVK